MQKASLHYTQIPQLSIETSQDQSHKLKSSNFENAQNLAKWETESGLQVSEFQNQESAQATDSQMSQEQKENEFYQVVDLIIDRQFGPAQELTVQLIDQMNEKEEALIY